MVKEKNKTRVFLYGGILIGPPILISKLDKKYKIGKKEYDIYFGINLLMGVIISAFSLIVLVAWCG